MWRSLATLARNFVFPLRFCSSCLLTSIIETGSILYFWLSSFLARRVILIDYSEDEIIVRFSFLRFLVAI